MKTLLKTMVALPVVAFSAYVAALWVQQDAVAGPHSWEWAGLRQYPDAATHTMRVRGRCGRGMRHPTGGTPVPHRGRGCQMALPMPPLPLLTPKHSTMGGTIMETEKTMPRPLRAAVCGKPMPTNNDAARRKATEALLALHKKGCPENSIAQTLELTLSFVCAAIAKAKGTKRAEGAEGRVNAAHTMGCPKGGQPTPEQIIAHNKAVAIALQKQGESPKAIAEILGISINEVYQMWDEEDKTEATESRESKDIETSRTEQISLDSVVTRFCFT